MIMIGTMNLTRTRDTGQFYCPTCGNTSDYRLRARRPFLTVYFIPLIPIGGAELFIDCRECREKWDLSVLEMDKQTHEETQLEQFRDEAVRSALLVVLEDGLISEAEISALKRIASLVVGREVDREELGEWCSLAEQSGILATNYVLTVSRRWNESQKSEALQAMFLAATAEGTMSESQTETMKRMRDILEMTDEEYQNAIEIALQRDV